MLYVSGKTSDDLLEVTDSYDRATRLMSIEDALALGTRVHGLHSNGTVMIYSSVQKFLDMYCMRQALCNNLVSYEIDYDVLSGLITVRSCSLSDSVVHDLVIPDFVDCIDTRVFEKNLTLRSVVIPELVRSIGFACFRGCENLESVVMEGTSGFELDIGDCAFENCRKLRYVHSREGIHNISRRCFNNCTGLHELQLPNSLVRISAFAFGGSGLKTIRIPDSVEVLDDTAFAWCANLKFVYTSGAIQSIKGADLCKL